MDHKDLGFGVDLESGLQTSDEDLSSNSSSGSKRQNKFCGSFEDGVNCGNVSTTNGASLESVQVVHTSKIIEGDEAVGNLEKASGKEKRKKSGNKKALKPPRPPRGPSLDAADQKMVREIAELAMLKRARVERMKALKKMKAAKASSSWHSNLLAMMFTVLFCLVVLYHGMSCRSSPESFQGSSTSTGASNDGGLISVQFYPIPSAVIPNGSGSESPNMVEQVAGSDPQEKLTRYSG